MARRPLPLRAARRALRLADRPLSFFEVRASGLSLRGRPTFPERQALDEIGWALVRPDTVYDIGAATGVYTLAAAKVSSVRQVVAFEPPLESFATPENRASVDPLVRCFNVAGSVMWADGIFERSASET
jgi:hypothetical protein